MPRFENTAYVTNEIVRIGALNCFEKFALETGTTMLHYSHRLVLSCAEKNLGPKRLLELVPRVVLKSCSSEVFPLRLLHVTFCAQF